MKLNVRWSIAGLCVALGGAVMVIAQEAGPQKLLDTLKAAIQDNKKMSDKVKAFAAEKILPLCTNEILVKETEAQNLKKLTIQQIQKVDTDWQKAEDELPIQKEMLSNACAKALKEFAKANPAAVETFAMDNLGANVGQSNLTTDYWQGDEAKWQKSFNGGKGGVDVGDVKFDKSSNAEVQQVSVPLIAKDGKVIGAVCIGINVSKL